MSGFVAPFYNFAAAITPSDTVNISRPGADCPVAAVYIGGGSGALVAVWEGGTTTTFAGLVTGTVLPISPIRINASSTTATNLIALYQV